MNKEIRRAFAERPRIKGNRVSAAQMELNLTDADMAGILGLGVRSYQAKVRGDRPWTLSDLIEIVFTTGHSFDYFFEMSDY